MNRAGEAKQLAALLNQVEDLAELGRTAQDDDPARGEPAARQLQTATSPGTRPHSARCRLSAVHPRFQVPHHAEVAVGVAVAVLVSLVDLRGAIGFSSFAVLAYYAVANASAWTLTADEGRPPRIVPAVGFLGCLVLAFTLPGSSVLAGSALLVLGAAIWGIRRVAPSRG